LFSAQLERAKHRSRIAQMLEESRRRRHAGDLAAALIAGVGKAFQLVRLRDLAVRRPELVV
jgi:hypothetical protein